MGTAQPTAGRGLRGMVSVACTCAPVNARWTSMGGGAGAAVTVEISQCSAAWTTAGRADRSSNTRDKGPLQVHTGGQTVRRDGFPPVRLRLSPEGESLHIYPYDHLSRFECLERCPTPPSGGPTRVQQHYETLYERPRLGRGYGVSLLGACGQRGSRGGVVPVKLNPRPFPERRRLPCDGGSN